MIHNSTTPITLQTQNLSSNLLIITLILTQISHQYTVSTRNQGEELNQPITLATEYHNKHPIINAKIQQSITTSWITPRPYTWMRKHFHMNKGEVLKQHETLSQEISRIIYAKANINIHQYYNLFIIIQQVSTWIQHTKHMKNTCDSIENIT